MVILQAYVFKGPGSCAAFLSNFHMKSAATVTFNNMHYDLPAWSISILPDCRNAVFNTAKVSKKEVAYCNLRSFLIGVCKKSKTMMSLGLYVFLKLLIQFPRFIKVGVPTSHVHMTPTHSRLLYWETYDEDLSSLHDRSSISTIGLLEQINVTRDTSDYLWYMTK